MSQVRRATLADKSAIFTFIKKAYQGRWEHKIPERWNWEYVNNPFLENDELPIWIAIDETGQVVGQSGAMIEPIKIGNTIQRIAWGVDLFVDSTCRGQGIASQLKLAATDGSSDTLLASLAMASITRQIYTKLGFVPIGSVSSFRRVIKLDVSTMSYLLLTRAIPRGAILKRGLAKLFRHLRIDRAITAVVTKDLERRDAKLAATLDKDVSIVQIEKFDKEIDLLWESVSPDFYAIVKRDHRYLNWKYVEKPYVDYFKFIARRRGKICGYLIIRRGQFPEPMIGIITDLFVSPEDKSTIMALISHSISFFKIERVRSIVAASNVPEYQECFRAFGFDKFEENVPMVRVGKPDADSEMCWESKKWFLCKGDHDWDQYPLANDAL